MPLNKSGLVTAITNLAVTPGATIAACAHAWAQAMQVHMLGVVPASLVLVVACGTLETALAAAFALQAPAAAAAMEVAFQAFGLTVGGGMAPTFTATPPAGSVGFATLFGRTDKPSHSAAAGDLSDAIDTWAQTGTAVLTVGGGSFSHWA